VVILTVTIGVIMPNIFEIFPKTGLKRRVKEALVEIENIYGGDYGDEGIQWILDEIVSGNQGIHQPEAVIELFGPAFFDINEVEDGYEYDGKTYELPSEIEDIWEIIEEKLKPFEEELTEVLNDPYLVVYFGHLEGDYGLMLNVDPEYFEKSAKKITESGKFKEMAIDYQEAADWYNNNLTAALKKYANGVYDPMMISILHGKIKVSTKMYKASQAGDIGKAFKELGLEDIKVSTNDASYRGSATAEYPFKEYMAMDTL
jgi:hypothetical protein